MATVRILHPHPALMLEGAEERYLVISDLHMGFETELSGRGINVDPSRYMQEMFEELSSIIRKEGPDSLVLLGDVKSSVHTITKAEWNVIPEFLERLLKLVKVVLIPGNHDGNIDRLVPAEVMMTGVRGMVMDDSLLIHGHTMPSTSRSSAVKRVLMGHVHPVFLREGSVLNGERVWIYLRAGRQQVFGDGGSGGDTSSRLLDIVVLPSFNRYFYYSLKKMTYRKSISPIIRKAMKHLDRAMVLTLDGSMIGDESLVAQLL